MERTAAACRACYAAKRRCIRTDASCERCVRMGALCVPRKENKRGRLPAAVAADTAATGSSSQNAHVPTGPVEYGTNDDIAPRDIVRHLTSLFAPVGRHTHVGVHFVARMAAVIAFHKGENALLARIIAIVSGGDHVTRFAKTFLKALSEPLAPTIRVEWVAMMSKTRNALGQQSMFVTAAGDTTSPNSTGRIICGVQMRDGIEYFLSYECAHFRAFEGWTNQDWENVFVSEFTQSRTHKPFMTPNSRVRLFGVLSEMMIEFETCETVSSRRTLTDMLFIETGEEVFKVVVILSLSANCRNSCVIFEIIPSISIPLPSTQPLLPFSQVADADQLQELLADCIADIADGAPHGVAREASRDI